MVECHFCFDPATSFFLELLVISLHSFPVAYWKSSDLGSSLLVLCFSAFSYSLWDSHSKNIGIDCHFLLQWAIFFSELFIMTCPSWVALHSITQNFKLCKPLYQDKAIIYEEDHHSYWPWVANLCWFQKELISAGEISGSPFTSVQHLDWKLTSIVTYITRKKYYLPYIHTASILSGNTHKSATQNFFEKQREVFTLHWFLLSFFFFFLSGYWCILIISYIESWADGNNILDMDYEVSFEETEPLLYLLFTTCAYYPFQLVLNILLNQVCFAWQAARQNAEMLRFAAMRAFIHKAAKQGDGRTSLIFTCLKAMDFEY